MRALAGKPEHDDSEQEEWESKKQLEGHHAEIEEGLGKAKRGHKKKIIQELEMGRKDRKKNVYRISSLPSWRRTVIEGVFESGITVKLSPGS